MTFAALLAPACAAAPPQVTLEVWASWPGSSVDEQEAKVVVPLEQALARLGPPTTEIVPGWSRTRLTVPVATTSQVNGVLKGAALPPGAHAWVQARPAEVSTWIVTGADEASLLPAARDLLEVAGATWGPDKVWTTSDLVRVWTAEVTAPLSADEVRQRAARLQPLAGALAEVVDGRTLREQLVAEPVAARPDRSATWNDRPAVLVHVAGNGAALKKLARERSLEVEAWPEEGYRVELWGADAEARAAEVVAAARAAGAPEVGVILGRGPLPQGTARRAEVIVSGPAPAELAGQPTAAWTKATAGPFAEGGATSPAPGPEWDVRIDPDRLAQLGATAEEVANQIRWRTSGAVLPIADDGLLRLTWGAPPDTAEELAARPLVLPTMTAPVSSVADVRRVEAPRYRRRP